ncbi:MAG: DUF937 domain-containing protein [Proteobacteria bacterium]|nr:DUF937 domain-containing protein [Pseudomonadota bacterium]
MGLFDELKSAATGALYQAGENAAQTALNAALQNVGGLQGVLDHLHAGGLSPLVASWASGQGQPISVDQLKAALPMDRISQIAAQLGLSPDQALAALSEHLPAIVGQAKG